jgi:hypothetical protein
MQADLILTGLVRVRDAKVNHRQELTVMHHCRATRANFKDVGMDAPPLLSELHQAESEQRPPMLNCIMLYMNIQMTQC